MFALFRRRCACLLAWVMAASMVAIGPGFRLSNENCPDRGNLSNPASLAEQELLVPRNHPSGPVQKLLAGTEAPCSSFTRTEDSERKSEQSGKIVAVLKERPDSQRPTCAAKLALDTDVHLAYRVPLAQVRLQI